MSSDKVKHIELVEAIIERMARNSFQLKGWAITLISLISVFATTEISNGWRFVVFGILLIPAISFWYLDAFYLSLERKYRILYARVLEDKIPPFCLDLKEIEYSHDEEKKTKLSCCVKAQCNLWFYGSLLSVILIFMIISVVYYLQH